MRNPSKAAKHTEISLFIGPEGGFTQREVEYAQSCGIVTVSLGLRIFRTETAGMMAAAIMAYEYGELNGDN